MSQIFDQIRKEMFLATKEGDEKIKGITQLVMAAVKNREIDAGEPLNDEQVIEVVRKEVKKLNDSITQYTAAGRQDLADESQVQLDYLNKFLPQLMGEEEVRAVLSSVIAEMGSVTMRDMGKVMGASMGRLKGKADGMMVKKVVEELLS